MADSVFAICGRLLFALLFGLQAKGRAENNLPR